MPPRPTPRTIFGSYKFPVLLLLSFLLISAHSATAVAAGLFDPQLKWRTIETEHFYVHYHEGLRPEAVDFAREAELAHAILTKRMEHVPRARVHLVVADTSDYSNGAARVFPYPQILVFTTPPTSESSPDYYDKWSRTLLVHEYAHLVVMDMTRGVPKALRHIMGYSIAMNAFVPGWWREGVSVYYETETTTAGRARSPYIDMALRSAVLESKFPSLDRAGDGLLDWPAGEAPYIFGGAFCSYLAEKYGEEKLVDFLHRYSGQIIPFRMDNAARETFGGNFSGLWSEWRSSLEEKYLRQKHEIESVGIRKGKRLTKRGYIIGKPVWSASPSKIVFYEYSPHSGGSISSVNPDGSNEKKLVSADTAGGMSFDPTGDRIAYAGLVPYSGKPSRRFYFYNDIYTYSLGDGETKRITEGERAGDPTWHPDGEHIAYVSRKGGRTVLATVNVETGEKSEIYRPAPEANVDDPAYSPDGSRIAFSAHHDGQNRDIFVLNTGDGSTRRITYHPARDFQPAWSGDGRYLAFVSERTGVANIFAYDLESRRLYQVTNVLGGAFEPAVGPKSEWLAYSGYSSEGFDLWVIPFEPAQWRQVERAQETPEDTPPVRPAPEVEISEEKNYSPWKTLPPRYLLPSLWYNGIDYLTGLSVGSADPLQRHSWNAGALYGSSSEFLSWSAAYVYSRRMPSVGVSAAQYAYSYGEIFMALRDLDGDGVFTLPGEMVNLEKDYYEKRSQATLFITESVGIKKVPITFRFGYQWQERDNLTDIPEMTADSMVPARGSFNGLEASVLFDGAISYPYSISPEKGLELRLAGDWYDEILGADYNQRIITADLRCFLPNPMLDHHVFAFRATGGVMDGDKLFQGTFRVGGSIGESIVSSPGTRYIALRGYELAQFTGDKAAVGSFEYRFPIAYPQAAPGMFPIFLQKIHAALFVDAGGAFDRKDTYPISSDTYPLEIDGKQVDQVKLKIKEDDEWNVGAGFEVRFTGYVGWGVLDRPMTLRIGFAKDATGGGLGRSMFLDLGTSF